jgi:hypothetical protein
MRIYRIFFAIKLTPALSINFITYHDKNVIFSGYLNIATFKKDRQSKN